LGQSLDAVPGPGRQSDQSFQDSREALIGRRSVEIPMGSKICK
jgi:hypothetical protein